MKCLNITGKLLIATVLFGITSPAKALDIDTRVGNGADAEIANDGAEFGDPAANSDDPRGLFFAMNTRYLPVFDPFNERYRASLMRFDITGVSGDLSNAGLSLHSVGSSRNIHVYALNDSAEAGIEDWDEASVTFDTAPGIVNMGQVVVDPNSGVVDPNHYTFLSEWRVKGHASEASLTPGWERDDVYTSYTDPNGYSPSISDPNSAVWHTDPVDIDPNFGSLLSDAIAADTNGLLTLLFFPKGDSQSEGNVAVLNKESEFVVNGSGFPTGNMVPNDFDGASSFPGQQTRFIITPTLHLPNATIGGPVDADFNNDGIVDGLDFLEWQLGNSPDPLSQADLSLWEAQYGSPPPVGAVSAVPEPTTCGLVLIGAAICVAWRRRNIA